MVMNNMKQTSICCFETRNKMWDRCRTFFDSFSSNYTQSVLTITQQAHCISNVSLFTYFFSVSKEAIYQGSILVLLYMFHGNIRKLMNYVFMYIIQNDIDYVPLAIQYHISQILLICRPKCLAKDDNLSPKFSLTVAWRKMQIFRKEHFKIIFCSSNIHFYCTKLKIFNQ